MIDEIDLDSSYSLSWVDQVSSTPPITTSPYTPAADNLFAGLKKYFFHKMEKKDFSEAEKIFDQFLQAGLSQQAAIALTDRKFFPAPHKAGHGNYLRNVIGDELFQNEQIARKGVAGKSKKHEYTKQMQTGSNPAGQYVLGIVEMAAGVGLMAAGVAVEIGSLGTLTVAVTFEEAAAAALVADGFARTMRNRDLSFDRNIPPTTWKSADVNAYDGLLSKSGNIDPSLPVNPDDLLKKPEWKETTHPDAEKHGHRTFENEETGDKLRHDEGKPWETGHNAHDHYHRPNPNKTGKHDEYLDNEFKPVPRHSDKSHLYSPENVWWNE